LMAVSVYVQGVVRVTVPLLELAAVISEIRAAVVQAVAACDGNEIATPAVTQPMSTAAPAVRLRFQVAKRLAGFRFP
jgi:hypothetical protein